MGPFWGFQAAWLSLVASVFDNCAGCNQNYIRIGGTYDSSTETMTTLSDPLGRSIAIWHGGNHDTVTATGLANFASTDRESRSRLTWLKD
jgi:hypothetical protein